MAQATSDATTVPASSQAIVAVEPGADWKPGQNWQIQTIHLPTLKEGEVLVEMVATGICHTDLSFTSPVVGQTFPIVVGHEGTDFSRRPIVASG